MEKLKFQTESRQFELTSDQLEVVMLKVQDINEPETGLHSIAQHSESQEGLGKRLTNLEAEFKNGILGQPYKGERIVNKEEWVKKAKDRECLFLYFNIIGRDLKSVEKSFWMTEGIRENPIALIFDLKNFKEVDMKQLNYQHRTTDNWQLPVPDSYSTKTYGGHGILSESIPNPDMGYGLNFRVSPSFFKGIVFRVDKESTEEDYKERKIYPNQRYAHKYIEVVDDIQIQKRVDEIVTVMLSAYKDRPERLLPIYDIHGNMWWPKRISYEEVKKMKENSARDMYGE